MTLILLELALGFGIGLSLGLLGGGGSLLNVPALVYLVGQTLQSAVTTSLVIVSANSMAGAMFHGSRGRLDWKVASCSEVPECLCPIYQPTSQSTCLLSF